MLVYGTSNRFTDWRQWRGVFTDSFAFTHCLTNCILQVFLAVNRLCVKYYNQSRSSRAAEMIIQASWIECYEARIAAICLDNPKYSATEARMAALKEACEALGWQEKDLRNRMCVLSKSSSRATLIDPQRQGYMAWLQTD